jgi:hypothetical protein
MVTSAYALGVENIDFITEERAVLPGTISDPITIQTQDSSGNSVQTTETIDLEFVSSSPTGEFLSSTGNPATKTMSKNTANRTFYYRDSSEGVFTITVRAVGRDTLKTWSANQVILVSLDAQEIGAESEESSNLSSTAGPSSPTSSNTGIEVAGGFDRITTPGSPITFRAILKKAPASLRSIKLSWSFGDGSVGEGEFATHTYRHPGEYVVVLNVVDKQNFSTSRMRVSVVEPDIALNPRDGYVEIVNNSKNEINLFNWKIIKGYKSFIFQPDTIILPKSSIMIDDSLFTMKSSIDGGVVLKNFLGQTISVFEDNSPIHNFIPEINIANALVSTSLSTENVYFEQDLNKQNQEIIERARLNTTTELVVLEDSQEGAGDNILETELPVISEDLPPEDLIFETEQDESILNKILKFVMGMLY